MFPEVRGGQLPGIAENHGTRCPPFAVCNMLGSKPFEVRYFGLG